MLDLNWYPKFNSRTTPVWLSNFNCKFNPIIILNSREYDSDNAANKEWVAKLVIIVVHEIGDTMSWFYHAQSDECL